MIFVNIVSSCRSQLHRALAHVVHCALNPGPRLCIDACARAVHLRHKLVLGRTPSASGSVRHARIRPQADPLGGPAAAHSAQFGRGRNQRPPRPQLRHPYEAVKMCLPLRRPSMAEIIKLPENFGKDVRHATRTITPRYPSGPCVHRFGPELVKLWPNLPNLAWLTEVWPI